MLHRALSVYRAQRREVAEPLVSFSAVYFIDSTWLTLPDNLKNLFPGFNTKDAAAAVKIQLLFDFLTGQVTQLAFQAGRTADQAYRAHLAWVKKDCLVIQDLGYFSQDMLWAIMQRDAYFLTRWHTSTTIYLAETGERVEMLSFLRQQRESAAEYDIQLGPKYHLPCRLVCVALPQEVADQRRRRAKKKGSRQGKMPSEERLALLSWNIFLTNVPTERLSLPQLLICYSMRWQVELIFKLWKSQAELDRLAGLRPQRILGEIYAKMIGIVLFHFLFAPLQFLLRDQGIELSPVKGWQVFQDRAKEIAQAIGDDLHSLHLELLDLSQRMLRFARKTKRKKRMSTHDKLLLADELEIYQLYSLT